ncbi:MAG TPA: flagellar assembly peptidoglycan hydrolase FlgJ [Nitrococcus sp.]|nr:flagellar assembly peptidoglycan hydrolase FlgJ [Nitrococcus sp.]
MTARNIAPYTDALDNRGLERLRRELRNPTPESIRGVAKQFEALFVQTLLKSMRAATPDDTLFGGDAVKQYRSLFDQQLALNVSQGSGIGLAAMLERQLLAQSGQSKDASPASVKHALAAYAHQPPGASSPGASAPAAPAADTQAPAWESPEAFVRSIWPAAERTANLLGVPPATLVAQAALETGWGAHVLQQADGRSSFNLFNIKAGTGWTGDTARATTVEYRNGIAVRETADFRVYGSIAEAFADYADLLRRQPRYAEALDSGGDAAAFLQSLQRAGYATDPAYADKVQRIMGSDALRLGGSEFKKVADRTNT